MNIKLSEVINTQKNLFPLSLSLFNELMSEKRYHLMATSKDEAGDITQITDFRAIFYFITESMAKAGVAFFSPGGSYQRRFIHWYNSYYWTDMNFEYEMEVKKHWVDSLHSMVLDFFHSDKLKINEVALDREETLTIEQGNKLTPLGKDFLLSLRLFESIKDKVKFID